MINIQLTVHSVVTQFISPKIENKPKILAFSALMYHYTGGTHQYNREEKEIKGIHFWNRNLILSLFADNIIMFRRF